MTPCRTIKVVLMGVLALLWAMGGGSLGYAAAPTSCPCWEGGADEIVDAIEGSQDCVWSIFTLYEQDDTLFVVTALQASQGLPSSLEYLTWRNLDRGAPRAGCSLHDPALVTSDHELIPAEQAACQSAVIQAATAAGCNLVPPGQLPL